MIVFSGLAISLSIMVSSGNYLIASLLPLSCITSIESQPSVFSQTNSITNHILVNVASLASEALRSACLLLSFTLGSSDLSKLSPSQKMTGSLTRETRFPLVQTFRWKLEQESSGYKPLFQQLLSFLCPCSLIKPKGDGLSFYSQCSYHAHFTRHKSQASSKVPLGISVWPGCQDAI